MDFEHLPRFNVAEMDAARAIAVLTVPSGCRNAACAGVGSLFRLASRTWPDQIYAVLCDDVPRLDPRAGVRRLRAAGVGVDSASELS